MNAPFWWPKSSLSTSSAGRAAQLSLISCLSLRGLPAWMASAKSSLPVPDSPRKSTVARLGATWRACLSTMRMLLLAATKFLGGGASWPELGPWLSRCLRRAISSWSWATWLAARAAATSKKRRCTSSSSAGPAGTSMASTPRVSKPSWPWLTTGTQMKARLLSSSSERPKALFRNSLCSDMRGTTIGLPVWKTWPTTPLPGS